MLDVGTYHRYRAVVENAVAFGDDLEVLTDNEETFVKDMLTKFRQYKRGTHLSEKQMNWLDQIETKLQSELGSQYEEYTGE